MLKRKKLMQRPRRLVVWLLLMARFAPKPGSAQNLTCSEFMVGFCQQESNRYCYVTVDDDSGEEKEECGTCLPDFVEWKEAAQKQLRCISQDAVDIEGFLQTYDPEYRDEISLEERAALLRISVLFIAAHQAQNPPPPYELGINMFSADSEQDVLSRQGYRSDISEFDIGDLDLDRFIRPREPELRKLAQPVSRIDHTELGHVSSVKHQGRCACCWAIATAGMIEGATAIQTGYLQSLSFQQMISCDPMNYGCDGGTFFYALIYSMTTPFGGISRLIDYPYTDFEGTTSPQGCLTDNKEPSVSVETAEVVVDFHDDFTFEERMERMKQAVAQQPVGVVVRTICPTMTNYKKGILTEDEACACNNATCGDHAVLMVGYDDMADPPYWKLKNSWSTDWGEDGYFRIAQTPKGNYGLFGVLGHGSIATSAFNLTEAAFDPEDSAALAYGCCGLGWLLLLAPTTAMLVGAGTLV